MRVKLTYPAAEFVLRQSSGERGVWGDARFETESTDGSWDAWVVYEKLPFPQTLRCDPNRTVFVCAEPESIRQYDARFLSQFAAVLSPQSSIQHANLVVSQPAIPWWVVASPDPSTQTGAFRRDAARSSETSTSAPPPSVTRQQSSTCSGELTRGESSTSATDNEPDW